MASQLRSVVTVNSATLGAKAKGVVSQRLEDRAYEAGQFMANRANQLMAERFDMNRPYERRRWPDSERASGAIDYFVEQRGDDVVFGYEIYDDEVFLRILGLNYGISGSFMEPTGNWPLSNGVPKALAWPDDSPKGYRAQTQVNHPGHGGYDFLDEARQEALNEYVRRLRT